MIHYAEVWQIPGHSILFFFLWRCGPTRAMVSSLLRFLDHTKRRITVGRTPLDAWSARRRDLYVTTHNTHNRQISTPPGGIEPQSQQWKTQFLGKSSPWCLNILVNKTMGFLTIFFFRKGINGRRLEWQKKLEEEDNIIVKWAQEDEETLYNLLNK